MPASRPDPRERLRRPVPATAAGDVLAGLPGQTFRLDPEGRILETWGPGVPGAPRLGSGGSLADAFPCLGRPALERALILAREAGAAQVRLPTRAGGEAWLGLDLSRGPAGDLVGRLTDQRDRIAHEAALEAAVRDAESRSAGKSRFLASLSHELRTPLNAIMGFADAMREEVLGPLPPSYRGYADLIHESGELLLELICDVLDMSRIEAERLELHPEIFDAREAAAAVIRLMRGQIERAGLTFVTPDMRERIEVLADRRALKQIALNLLSNAIKATPTGGRVFFSVHAEEGELRLSVADTGRGILPEDLDRLGRPFEQAGSPEQRASGTGLGLSLVKALAGLHGGAMSIRSRLWEGTEVTVRLPVIVEDHTQPELDLNGSLAPGSSSHKREPVVRRSA